MTVLPDLAAFCAAATSDAAAQRVACDAVADCFGCILAGAESDVAQRITAAVAEIATGDAPLFGTQRTLSAPFAALVNGAAGHAFDLDDWEEPANTHPSVVLVPALLASAHIHRASGQDMINAYVVGFEVIVRLGEAVTIDHWARGFHSTATLGAIGAAAAVARQLTLSPQQTAHAMSLATSQAVGYTKQIGSNAKAFQAGHAAQAGLVAALLAKSGVTGAPDVIDNPRGFAGLLGNDDAVSFAVMLKRLARPFAVLEHGIILKPWPSCGYVHRLMTAALDLRSELDNCTDHITAIHASLPDFHYRILPFDKPRTATEALFSVPACVGQTLVTGDLTLADSANAFWTEPQVNRLIDLTMVSPEPARNPLLNYDPDQPDILEISLEDGRQLRAACQYPQGAPQNPMNGQQLADKFHSITGRPAAAFDRLRTWPRADDVALFFAEAANR